MATPDLTAATSTGLQGARTDQFLALLKRREDMTLTMTAHRLMAVQANVQADLDHIVAKIAKARAEGEDLSPSWLYRERRYRTLMARLDTEVQVLLADTMDDVVRIQTSALQVGRQFAGTWLGVEGTMADWSPEAMRGILGGLHDGSPLADLIQSVAGATTDAVKNVLVTGITTGKGVAWMTRQARRALDVPRWRTETIVRTESMRAFRHGTRQTFTEAAEADAITGWTWVAALDSRTCPACMVMHGTEHAIQETLDGHPNCRCVMVPNTPDWDEILGPGHGLPDTRPTIQTGKDWFNDQPEAVQKAMLGPAKWQAWKDGHITLDDVVRQDTSAAWGTHRREASLAEIARSKGVNARDWKALPEESPAQPEKTWKEMAEERGFYNFRGMPGRYSQAALADALDTLLDMEGEDLARMIVGSKTPVNWLAARAYAVKHPGMAQPRWVPPKAHMMDPEDAHEAARATNPRYVTGREYQVNCTNCVTAYEARRRGIRATAKPRPTLEGRATHETPLAWGADPTDWWKAGDLLDAEKKIIKDYPEGARGAISLAWKGRSSGHIMNWEKKDGKVIWVEAQDGSGPNDDHRLNVLLNGKNVRVIRLDHLPMTEALKDYINLE